MSKSQRRATIAGRLVGMAGSIYFWFILNNYGSDHPEHQSIFVAAVEDQKTDLITVIGIFIVSTLLVTFFAGFVFRLLFSFREEE